MSSNLFMTEIEHLPFYSINDAELDDTTNNNTQNYPLSVLNTLIFNSSSDANRPNHTVDYLNEPVICDPICDYIFSNELPSQLSSSNSLKIFSYNISSIPQHLDSLHDQCLSSFSVTLDVIGLCETRLNDNICQLYQLENYLPYFQNKSTQSGGLAIYLHNKCQSLIALHTCILLQQP